MRGRITIGLERTGRGSRPARGVPTAALLLMSLWNPGRAADASAIQIMPLGDSITEGYSSPGSAPGGYRAPLYRDLTAAGYDVQFVGSQTTNPDPTLPAAAQSHEGHIGFVIAGTGAQASSSIGTYIDQWLAPGNGIDPKLILLELGTNEFLLNYHVSAAPFELAALITRITELRPNAQILVSTLPPNANAAWNAEVQAFNKSLGGPDGIVAQLQKLGEDVTLVNAGGSLTMADLNSLGTHPTQAGYNKLGTAWFNAIESNAPLNGLPGPAPEPSTLAVLVFGSLGLLAIARSGTRSDSRA